MGKETRKLRRQIYRQRREKIDKAFTRTMEAYGSGVGSGSAADAAGRVSAAAVKAKRKLRKTQRTENWKDRMGW